MSPDVAQCPRGPAVSSYTPSLAQEETRPEPAPNPPFLLARKREGEKDPDDLLHHQPRSTAGSEAGRLDCNSSPGEESEPVTATS